MNGWLAGFEKLNYRASATLRRVITFLLCRLAVALLALLVLAAAGPGLGPGPGRAAVSPGGMLFPRESESRDVRTLDGVWNFRLCPEEDPEQGSRERWFHQDLTQVGTARRHTKTKLSGKVSKKQEVFVKFYPILPTKRNWKNVFF